MKSNLIKNIAGLLIFASLFSLPNIIEQIFVKEHGILSSFLFSYGLTISLFGVFVYFFRNKFRLLAKLAFPLALLVPVILIPYFYIRTLFNLDIIYLIAGTNPLDSAEFGFVNMIAMLLILIVYSWVYFRLIRLLPKQIPSKWALSLSLFSGGFILLGPLLVSAFLGFSFSTTQLVSRNKFVDFGLQWNSYFRDIQDQNNYSEVVDGFKFKTKCEFDEDKRQIHVLVLGESARVHNWSLFGYERETNPLLSQRQDLITFTNVVAGGTYTARSIPLIISRATPSTYDKHLKEPCLAKAFEECGFDTYYINMNPKYELSGVANTIHHKDFTHVIWNEDQRRGETKYPLDDEMIAYVDEIIQNSDKNVFIMLYQLGSHMKYYNRYSPQFAKFKPDNYGEVVSKKIQQEMINAYDNSIVYTDYFLDTLIKRLEKEEQANATMLYISDHGENLYDNKDETFGHGTVSKEVLEVPMIYWVSSNTIEANSGKVDLLKKHRAMPIGSSENVFHTFTDVAGIKVAGGEGITISEASFQPNEQEFSGENGKLSKYKDVDF